MSTTRTSSPSNLEFRYGQTPTPNESPSLIQESMNSFCEMLERDGDENSNWRLAEVKCPTECRDEFKLTFLRCEVFRVKLAVKRYIKYWDSRVELFGPDKAFLPILDLGPNGPMRDNLKELNCGYTKMAPPGKCQDPDGRAIFFVDGPSLDVAIDDPDMTTTGMVRASWYCAHVILLSEAAQRRGVVVVYRPITSLNALLKSPAKAVSASLKGSLPIRCAAMHVTDPPALMSLLVKLAGSIIGTTMKKRIHVHNLGSHEKNLESLSRFGIHRKQLPKELGGDFAFEEVVKFESRSVMV